MTIVTLFLFCAQSGRCTKRVETKGIILNLSRERNPKGALEKRRKRYGRTDQNRRQSHAGAVDFRGEKGR